jgi:thiamine transporter ThiT
MTDAAHDYHPGDQDITEQRATFSLFGKLIKWASLAVAVLIVMLVLWFCVGAGFFGGLIPGLVVLCAGIYFLRSRPEESH